MQDIAGVLCDLDGTIINSEAYHLQAWDSLLMEYGQNPTSDWHEGCIGMPDSFAVEKARRLFPAIRAVDNFVDRKQDRYLEIVSRQGEQLAFPGVPERLAALQAAGLRLAIGTNSIMRNTIICLETVKLRHFFPVIVTMDTVAHGKPAPDIYQLAAERVGLKPKNCIVLEDSKAGIHSARAAGCQILAVTNSSQEADIPGADRYFTSTPEAMDWILKHLK